MSGGHIKQSILALLNIILVCFVCSSCSRNEKQETSPAFSSHISEKCQFCETQASSYYFVPSVSPDFIWYWDTKSSACIPLCDRPDCSHDSTDCNAYLGWASPSTIQMVEGKLYIWAGASPSFLYRVNIDGSGREIVITAPEQGQPLESFIIGDDVYLLQYKGQNVYGNDVVSLLQLSLTDSYPAKIISDMKMDDGWSIHTFGDVKWLENSLFYSCVSVSSDLQMTRTYLFRYDPVGDKSDLILQEDHALTFTAVDGNLITCWSDTEDCETVVRSLETGEVIRTVPIQGGLRSDEKYIYLNDIGFGVTGKYDVYDHDFHLIDTFSFETTTNTEVLASCIARGDFVFYYNVPNENGWYDEVYRIYSKSDIGREEHSWMEMTVPCQMPID